MTTRGLLLLYCQPVDLTAPTIVEHVEAFERYSAFRVWAVNTAHGFPHGLEDLQFDAVVLHYSLFGPPSILGEWPEGLDQRFKDYLRSHPESYTVAFFQDEYHYCQSRFAFIREHAVDCVYTLLDPRYWDEVYRAHAPGLALVHTLTGYVSDTLIHHATALRMQDVNRRIDIGYRARRLPYYMGRGGQEKGDIADAFLDRCSGRGLVLDIDVDERSRIYGSDWWRFLASCRGVLGVEAGVSIFDLDDSARIECARLLRSHPGLSFEEAHARLLHRWDGRIDYRTISPRHFEAAALEVTQILFEGEYQGILRPGVHYLSLRKDFSNIDEVLEQFGDGAVRRRLADASYRDLIASGRWSYARFVEDFDAHLRSVGLVPVPAPGDAAAVDARLSRGTIVLALRRRLTALRHAHFPGRPALAAAARRFLRTD